MKQYLSIQTYDAVLEGCLVMPSQASSIVVFGLDNNRCFRDSQTQYIAQSLNNIGIATLLLDLLTSAEESVDLATRHLQFDSFSLAYRLMGATDWLQQHFTKPSLNIGYFESGERTAASVIAACERSSVVKALVSRGLHPDLGGMALASVTTPTLLIVGGNDQESINFNQDAFKHLATTKQLEIIPGTTHHFEEPQALERLAQLTCQWFQRYLSRTPVMSYTS